MTLARKLVGNTDAEAWAEAFVQEVKMNPAIATDKETMVGWFANAIMAGYDRNQKDSLSEIPEQTRQQLIDLFRINGAEPFVNDVQDAWEKATVEAAKLAPPPIKYIPESER